MLTTCREMREAETRAFEDGISAAGLMEAAGQGIARVIWQFFPAPGTAVLFLGGGNNAGDALVAGRELARHGWRLLARLAVEPERMKPLAFSHWQSLQGVRRITANDGIEGGGPLLCLDGLLGIGASGPLRAPLRGMAAEMNRLRLTHGAVTVAMDIPSGLDGDTGLPEEDAVVADLTVTVAAAKTGLVADEATHHAGRLALVPLPELAPYLAGFTGPELLTPGLLRGWAPRRSFDFHKGQAGRVGIIAGSRGYYGAAVLACLGALRGGAGLVTLLVKEDSYETLARMVPPEIMVRPVRDYRKALELRLDALALGPGLGFAHEGEILEIIEEALTPCVVDADALTLLSRTSLIPLKQAAGPRLLTPHPGEMERLCDRLRPRLETAQAFADAHPGHTLLLKGARTVIATAGEAALFNTTGHPGMATGGMGDLLSGLLAALLGQGMPAHRAAGFGAWLCGRAAERAALSMAAESVLPSDAAAHFGGAWAELRQGGCC